MGVGPIGDCAGKGFQLGCVEGSEWFGNVSILLPGVMGAIFFLILFFNSYRIIRSIEL
ncbi:uncharacterized protein BDW47DRAFT_100691 [Aspergillus candidus]|uniref:Uncharacterized protein n=1 Tax=Aspergillus candidus TaxID=41067 RepID=A0A2I2FJC1_ASPCN|nr:hypothetical protein BDW47DRAFT_100691 [Aspergillus candidus]PLB40710.1 hypothetical protein BDW47DRAFT_100691 [Aspergillus candidus]